MNSANRCIDNEDRQMIDFEYIETYMTSEKYLNFIERMSNIPLFGLLFK